MPAIGCAINRYYTPVTGSFLSVDPMVATTTAPYVYATNDPVNVRDPSGMCSWFNAYCEVVQPAASEDTHILDVVRHTVAHYADNVVYSSAYTWFNKHINPAYFILTNARSAYREAQTSCSSNWGIFGHSIAAATGVATFIAGPIIGEAAAGTEEAAAGAEADLNLATEAASGNKLKVVESSGQTFVGTAQGTTYDMPEGWVSRTAENGRGIVFQEPGAMGNANSIRIMEPTAKYPTGYVRYYNQYGQPLDVYGNPGPPSVTHIPQDYQGPWPGWP